MSKSASSGGLGITGTLLVVFVVLKLTGNVSWTWTWVLAPMWLPWLFVAAVWLLIVAPCRLVAAVLEARRTRRRMDRIFRGEE